MNAEDHDEITLSKSQRRIWVTVNNISICIVRTDEGVVVDMWPLGQEGSTSMATTYAFFKDADLRFL
jgi:hypothetical protein